jgi:hypothetical protein
MKQLHVSEILEQCLEQVLSGQETIDSVLAKFPEYAQELRPELDTALWLQDQRSAVDMRPGYLTASRSRLVKQINRTQEKTIPAKKPLLAWNRSVFRFAFAALFLLITVFSMRGGALAVQASLPGDTLHRFKLAAEDMQVSLTSDDADEASLRIEHADERAREIEELMDLGRYEDATVAFQNYRTNLSIAGDLIANLEADPEQTIILAQQLALKVEEHNQVFSAALASSVSDELPGDLVSNISVAVAFNQDIVSMMAVLLDELGAQLVPFDPSATATATGTVTETPTGTPTETPTETPSVTPEPGTYTLPGGTPAPESSESSDEGSDSQEQTDKVKKTPPGQEKDKDDPPGEDQDKDMDNPPGQDRDKDKPDKPDKEEKTK